MKFSQILAAIVTLSISLWAVSWVVQSRSSQVNKATSAPTKSAESPADDEHAHVHDHDHEQDYYDTNPFSLAESGVDGPRAEAPRDPHVVDRMAKGTTGSHDFVIRNVGNAPLKLAKGPSNCKCTVAGLKDQEVPPGGEATIHLEFTPVDVGPFRQGAKIWTNDPNFPEVSLNVEAEVVSEVVSEPANNWLLGVVLATQDSKFQGVLYSGLFDEFEITSIETSSELLTVTAEPFSEADLRQYDAKSGYQLRGILKGTESAGQISEKVVVHTSLQDYPKFEYTVTGTQTGPILVVGPGWYGGRQLVDLGIIESQQGKTHKLTFMVEPFDAPLEFTRFKSNPGFVKVSLEPAGSSSGAARERYIFTLEVPAGSPIGRWPAEKPGEVTIETNHPKQPVLKLNLQLDVRDAANR